MQTVVFHHGRRKIMRIKPIFYRITGIAFAAAFILTSCNFAATTAAPVNPTATQAPAASPIAPTATLPPAATATATPVPTATATVAPTATTQLTPQVIPSINAYCRKGPGSGYYEITYLQQGTPYNVVGRTSLNTWWLVQASANVTCWIGDPNATQQGPVDQAKIALVQPLPVTPATFVESNTCNTTAHTLSVLFNWSAVANVTGYRIFRNGTQITDAGPTSTAYTDSSAPTGTNLVYGLEAHNDYGAAPLITVSVPTCD
jgi:hypothetical protein